MKKPKISAGRWLDDSFTFKIFNTPHLLLSTVLAVNKIRGRLSNLVKGTEIPDRKIFAGILVQPSRGLRRGKNLSKIMQAKNITKIIIELFNCTYFISSSFFFPILSYSFAFSLSKDSISKMAE